MSRNRVLIVEDEAIVALDLRGILRSLGYEVVGTADSGTTAVKIAREEIPDLVLMDIVLKGSMDGVETAQILMEDMGLPVIFLTASGDGETWKRILRVRPAGYIHKPYDLLTLKFALESARMQSSATIQRAEDSVREFQPIFDRVPDPLVLLTHEGRPIVANMAFYETFGWGPSIMDSPEAFFSRFLYGKNWRRVHQDVCRDLWSWVERDTRFLCRNGEAFPVRIHVKDCGEFKSLVFQKDIKSCPKEKLDKSGARS